MLAAFKGENIMPRSCHTLTKFFFTLASCVTDNCQLLFYGRREAFSLAEPETKRAHKTVLFSFKMEVLKVSKFDNKSIS